MKKISNVEDLQVYRKLCALHLEINDVTINFPEFELYELGAQLRKTSNAAPASIAQGWTNKHLSLEVIHKVLEELNGTKHYLNCGNSSILYFLRNLPTLVTRLSPPTVICGPIND